jgi:hypothetical protein
MSQYFEHPSRASRFVDGGYVVHPDAAREDTTVWFSIEPGQERWEGILAMRAGQNRARLVGVPLFAYGLNLDDVVEFILSAEGAPVAVRVVAASSNTTFRVVFPDLGPDDDDDRWRQILRDMEPWNCWFDLLSPGYLAISAPDAHADAAERYLMNRANGGDFIYERGDVSDEEL